MASLIGVLPKAVDMEKKGLTMHDILFKLQTVPLIYVFTLENQCYTSTSCNSSSGVILSRLPHLIPTILSNL